VDGLVERLAWGSRTLLLDQVVDALDDVGHEKMGWRHRNAPRK
jgi:hypothetical protein